MSLRSAVVVCWLLASPGQNTIAFISRCFTVSLQRPAPSTTLGGLGRRLGFSYLGFGAFRVILYCHRPSWHGRHHPAFTKLVWPMAANVTVA